MVTWFSRLARAALLMACVWQLPQLSSAQPQPGDSAAPQSDDYAVVVRAAEAAFLAQNFAESRTRFAHAHALQPSARTLRGMGSASFALEAYDEAVVELEQALASTVKPLDGELRQQTRALLDRAYGFVGRYMVGLTPASAELWVDQLQTALRTGDRLVLTAGPHTLEARAAGHALQERKLEVGGGEDVGFSFVLVPSAAIATATEAAQTVASSDRAPSEGSLGVAERQPGRPLYKNPWLWAGVGVVLAAVATTVGVLSARDQASVGAVSATPNTPLGGTVLAPLRSR